MPLLIVLIATFVLVYVISQVAGPMPPHWEKNLTGALILALVLGGLYLWERVQTLQRSINNLSDNLARLRRDLGR